MARFELGVRTPAAAAGAAYADLRTGASQQAEIVEIGIFLTAATATPIGLIRPNALGTATSPQLGQNRDPNGAAAISSVGIAWSVAPTIAGTPAYLRRVTLPATIGSGLIWTWPVGRGLIVPVSSSLIIWNFGAAAGSISDLYIVWEE